MYFPISGVEVSPWLPPLVAFLISLFTSLGGVSGAFILLPFQVSVLGYTSPSVSATNQLFNVFATPSGIYRFTREQRMLWPLAAVVILGTLPGVFAGVWIRVRFLPDSGRFKVFVACVLLVIATRLLLDVSRKRQAGRSAWAGESGIEGVRVSLRKVEFLFAEESHAFPVIPVLLFCFAVGAIGGAYGIGGGAVIAPFLVSFFSLPVYVVAGAAMLATFATSVTGVLLYEVVGRSFPELSARPDWLLGLLFGAGGFCGIYLGSRWQKHVPSKVIKLILVACCLFVALRYLYDKLPAW